MNELRPGNSNALDITKQYPENKYNLLVPIKTVTEIAEIHKPVMNVVYISTVESDKEIYLQTKPDGWALTKKGLTKLMKAAGIKVLSSKPLLPTQCEKCSVVNRNIGKPVNCGTCSNKDVKHQVTISMPQLTGENVNVVGTKEIIFNDVTESMTVNQKKEFAKFRSEMCETKALNRALRTAMQIKPTYSKAELAKPFVVAYLVPNLNNPEVKKEAVKSFFSTSNEIYGVTESAAEAQKVIYTNDSMEDDDIYIIEDNSGSPEDAEAADQTNRETIESNPDYDPTICEECGAKCTGGVVRYSRQQYGRTLCMSCQRNQGGNQ